MHESVHGPKPTSAFRPLTSAFEGRADVRSGDDNVAFGFHLPGLAPIPDQFQTKGTARGQPARMPFAVSRARVAASRAIWAQSPV
jgi:hypothetical protein